MILLIDDDIAVRTSLALLLGGNGYKTAEAGNSRDALLILQSETPALILLDLNFSLSTSGREGMELLKKIKSINSSIPVILITGWGSIELAVEGMKLGANDFINKPWSNEHLLQSVKTHIQLNEVQALTRNRKELDEAFEFKNIIGQDKKVLRILHTIGRVAETDASILITGESGTGKELVAEAIHRNSLRKNRPFVKVNLGGISTSLFESEMFGHIRGAFTDAKMDRVGRFEMANKGSIFLDEIGDLDPSSQVKLLRVLQDRTYEVLGSSRTKNLDVRVICATNRNLNEMVAAGTFREDLLYRINLISIELPALRERSEDIPLLADFFLNNLKDIYNRPNLTISKDAYKWLRGLTIPGNIRQLKNLVERTVLVSDKDMLETKDFQSQLELSPSKKGNIQLPDVGSFSLEQVEILMIRKALEFHQNRITRTAAALGLTRSSLYRRMDKYNIPYDANQD